MSGVKFVTTVLSVLLLCDGVPAQQGKGVRRTRLTQGICAPLIVESET